MMNNSSWNYDPGSFLLDIPIPVICVSTLLFLVAISLVIAFKLHRLLVYRLALYQVISAEICFVFMILIYYLIFNTHTMHNALGLEFLLSFALSSILFVLTAWIVFHLFALSVFHKNLKRLEPLYVVSSIAVAIVIIILSFSLYITEFEGNYYNASHDVYDCGLYKFGTAIFYFGIILLVVSSVLVIIMVVTLCCRAFKAKNGIVLEYQKQHKKVLYEMLPLFVYIIFYLIVMFPMLSLLMIIDGNTYETIPNSTALRHAVLLIAEYLTISFFVPEIAIALWSIGSSSTLIIHILIVQCYKKHKKYKNHSNSNYNGEDVTVGETTTILNTCSETYFSLPTED